jgi:hypothetical protein
MKLIQAIGYLDKYPETNGNCDPKEHGIELGTWYTEGKEKLYFSFNKCNPNHKGQGLIHIHIYTPLQKKKVLDNFRKFIKRNKRKINPAFLKNTYPKVKEMFESKRKIVYYMAQ